LDRRKQSWQRVKFPWRGPTQKEDEEKIHHKDAKVTKTDIFTGDNEGDEGIKVKALIGMQHASGDVSRFTFHIPSSLCVFA